VIRNLANFRPFFLVFASIFMLGTTVSCAASQEEDMGTSSSASEIVFPEGATLTVDLPMPTQEFLDSVERRGATYRTVSAAPSIEGVDSDRVYKISTDYDPKEKVQRQYFAYEKDDMIVHLEARFNRPNPY